MLRRELEPRPQRPLLYVGSVAVLAVLAAVAIAAAFLSLLEVAR